MVAIDFVVHVILRCTQKNAEDTIFRRVDVAEVGLLAKEVDDLAKLAVKEVRCGRPILDPPRIDALDLSARTRRDDDVLHRGRSEANSSSAVTNSPRRICSRDWSIAA